MICLKSILKKIYLKRSHTVYTMHEHQRRHSMMERKASLSQVTQVQIPYFNLLFYQHLSFGFK